MRITPPAGGRPAADPHFTARAIHGFCAQLIPSIHCTSPAYFDS
jgi:hypothetical protein